MGSMLRSKNGSQLFLHQKSHCIFQAINLKFSLQTNQTPSLHFYISSLPISSLPHAPWALILCKPWWALPSLELIHQSSEHSTCIVQLTFVEQWNLPAGSLEGLPEGLSEHLDAGFPTPVPVLPDPSPQLQEVQWLEMKSPGSKPPFLWTPTDVSPRTLCFLAMSWGPSWHPVLARLPESRFECEVCTRKLFRIIYGMNLHVWDPRDELI